MTGSALRRRQRRLRQWLRDERMTVAMALAEATHRAAPPRQKPASAITVNDAPRGHKDAGAEYFELSSDEEVAPARGSRPPCLGEPRGPQARVQRHTVEQMFESFVPVPVLDHDVPVPQMEDQLVGALTSPPLSSRGEWTILAHSLPLRAA